MASILTWDLPVCSLLVLPVAEWVLCGRYDSLQQSTYMHIRSFDDSELSVDVHVSWDVLAVG